MRSRSESAAVQVSIAAPSPRSRVVVTRSRGDRVDVGAPSIRCAVCGSAAVQVDAVEDVGLLHLAECRRCEHRWTSREPLAAAGPAVRPWIVACAPASDESIADDEVASAA